MLSAAILAVYLTTVTLHAPRASLRVEVAATESSRERGLMDRDVLPAHAGMLFVFPNDGPVEFWMKDTRIPLDMVFVGRDGIVRSIAAAVPVVPARTPDDGIPRRRGRAMFVIELPSGEAARDGLRPGIRIRGLTGLTGRTRRDTSV